MQRASAGLGVDQTAPALATTDLKRAGVVVLPKGKGENNLHVHTGSDSYWLVLKGKVACYGPEDKLVGELGLREGTTTPHVFRYCYANCGEEHLEMRHAFANATPGRHSTGPTDAAQGRRAAKRSAAKMRIWAQAEGGSPRVSRQRLRLQASTIRHLWLCSRSAAALALLATPAPAQEPYYKDKQIRLIVGAETGAGYDTYARLLARHMGRHIPGQPGIVIQNMPGAGGLVSANHLFNIAPKNGLTIGSFQRDLPLQSILDRERTQFKFDATKFSWIGSSSSGANDAYLMVVRSDVPVNGIEDVRAGKPHQLVLAATAQGSQSYDVPSALVAMLGLNIRVVGGYPSAAAMSLALQRKEAEARMIGFSSLRATQPEWLRDKFIRVLVQFGRVERHQDLADVPTARELATNQSDRDLIEMMEASQLISWPYMAPPDVPGDVVKILRDAFMATQKDGEFVGEATKASMELSPIDGAAIDALMTRLNAIPAATIERYLALSKTPAKTTAK